MKPKERSVLKTPHLEELKKKRRRATRNKILLCVFGFLIFVTGLSFLSKISSLSIKSVEIRGANILDPQSIKDNVNLALNGNYFYLFSKHNVFLYPEKKIKKQLSSIPRIKSFNVYKENFSNLVVDITERENKYTWCGNDIPADNSNPKDNKCYFMDNAGYIFDEAPYFSGNVYFRFFGKIKQSIDNPSGSYFMPDSFEKITSFKNTLEGMNIKLSAFLAKEDGDMEFYLSSDPVLTNAPKIIFKSDADFEKLAENLQAVMTVEPLKSYFDKKGPSLLYIDLRFGNKVYYKFQNETPK